MKTLLALLALALTPDAYAATGYRCELDDQVNLYHSTGRHADWGKRQVETKCQELSPNPSLCRFRGCRKVQISEAWARSSDRERAALQKRIAALKRGGRSKPQKGGMTAAQRRAVDAIDDMIRRNEQIEENYQLKRIADELERRRRGW